MIINSFKNLIEADDKQVRETFSAVYLSSFFFLFSNFWEDFFLWINNNLFAVQKHKLVSWFTQPKTTQKTLRCTVVPSKHCCTFSRIFFLISTFFNQGKIFWLSARTLSVRDVFQTVGHSNSFPSPFVHITDWLSLRLRLLWLTTWLRDHGCDGCQENKQVSFPSVFPTAQPGEAESKREARRHPLSSKGTSGPFSRSHLGHLPASGFTFSPLAPQSCPRDALTTRCPTGAPCDSEMEETRFAATFFLPPFLKPVICQRCDGGECQLETWDEGKTLSFWQQQQQKPNGSADPFDDTGEPGQTGWIDYFHLDVRTEANANETKVLTLFLESHLQLDPEWMHLVMWVQPCFSFSIQNHLKPTRSWNGSKTSDGCFLGHKTNKKKKVLSALSFAYCTGVWLCDVTISNWKVENMVLF